MIELIIFDYIKSNIDTPIFFEEKNLVKYLLLEKTSTTYNEGYCQSEFILDCYEESLYKTIVFMNEMKPIIQDLIDLKEVVKVDFKTDYNSTDTEKKKYRYSLEFEVIHY